MTAARDKTVLTMGMDFDELVDAIARKVVELQRTPDYYTPTDAPIKKRAFLEAARRGDFPSSKLGKLVIAKRADVDAWIATKRRQTAANDTVDLKGYRLAPPGKAR